MITRELVNAIDAIPALELPATAAISERASVRFSTWGSKGVLKYYVKKGMQKATDVGKKGLTWVSSTAAGFRDFLLRGNVVDLAVAIVVGVAFVALVKAFVADFITPLIAAIWGGKLFNDLYFEIHHSKFLYGDFINQLITFVAICLIVYFCVVVPVNALIKKIYGGSTALKDCPFCKEKVNELALKCKFCCADLVTYVEKI